MKNMNGGWLIKVGFLIFAASGQAHCMNQIIYLVDEKTYKEALVRQLPLNNETGVNFDHSASRLLGMGLGYVEFYIFLRAVNALKKKYDVVLGFTPNIARSRLIMKSEKMYVTSSWGNFQDSSFVKTIAYTEPNQLSKVFISRNKEIADTFQSTKRFDEFVAGNVVGWETDELLLRKLNFRDVYYSPKKDSLRDMLKKGRFDIIIDFPNTDLIDKPCRNVQGECCIVGYKLNFPYPRHFLIFKANKERETFAVDLNESLAAMKKTGQIREILSASGLINQRIDGWVNLLKLP